MGTYFIRENMSSQLHHIFLDIDYSERWLQHSYPEVLCSYKTVNAQWNAQAHTEQYVCNIGKDGDHAYICLYSCLDRPYSYSLDSAQR